MNDQDNELTPLYGTGWGFPMAFDLKPSSEHSGSRSPSSLVMSSGAANVAQSLALLFQTQPGERMMRPEFGCDLHSSVFANLSEGTLANLQHKIAESVARNEPRADGVTVDVKVDPTQKGMLRICVYYQLMGRAQQVTGRLNLLDGASDGGSAWATL